MSDEPGTSSGSGSPAAADDGWEQYRSRLDGTPFAVLATHGPDRRLDLVPCCFALVLVDGHDPGPDGRGLQPELVSAVDHKPKRHQRLARLANIEADPHVTLLLDHRDPEDWGALWWLRIQGLARVVPDGPEHRSAVDALAAKYRQYRQVRPTGTVIRIVPTHWAGWGL